LRVMATGPWAGISTSKQKCSFPVGFHRIPHPAIAQPIVFV
jgi:hypothetical protein